MPNPRHKHRAWGLFLFVILFVQITAGSLLPVQAVPQPNGFTPIQASYRILILNSYHPGYAWTESLEDTLMRLLEARFSGIDIASEYLDWKRHPNKNALALQVPTLHNRYADSPPDLVLTTDDAALLFALDNRTDLFGDAPIVFCGVMEETARSLRAAHGQLTGVIENFDVAGTIQAAFTMLPDTKRVILVYDNMETGIPLAAEAKEILKQTAPQCKVEHWNTMSALQIRNGVRTLPKDTVVLFMSYSRDADGLVLPMDQFGDLLFSNSSVPVFTLHDFAMGHQVIGGSVISGPRHAEAAAKLAIRVLGGVSAGDIPLVNESTVSMQFDYNQMVRYGIQESDLPPDSEILYRPFSFYRTYQPLVVSVAAVFAILLTMMMGLVLAIRDKKRSADALRSSHEELVATNGQMLAVNAQLLDSENELLTRNAELETQKRLLEQSQDTIRHMAYYDALTGLPNRILLRATTEEALGQVLSTKHGLALIFADMDNFKVINDSFGHPTGDLLLRQIASRFSEVVPQRATVARTGGDEFILLLPDYVDLREVEELAREVVDHFRVPLEVDGMHFHMSLSLGIALYPGDGNVFDDLMRSADTAMYAAKTAGKNQYRFFDHRMDAVARDRFLLEDGLRHALDGNELQLYYQPVHRLSDNRLVSFEALLRWHSPKHGWVTPDRFIPISEETGLILPIGDWVLQEGCRFLQRVMVLRQSADHGDAAGDVAGEVQPPVGIPDEFHLAVNVSVLQLMQANFTERVLQLLSSTGTAPGDLVLEITESVLIESFEDNAEQLRTLSEAGIHIALDDFGTGYSSLTYLQRLPIQMLKIDKSFIDGIRSADDDTSHTGSIIALAREWGLQVVAEGVEREEQRAYLKRNQCDLAQGYLMSRPIPADEALAYLKAAYGMDGVIKP